MNLPKVLVVSKLTPEENHFDFYYRPRNLIGLRNELFTDETLIPEAVTRTGEEIWHWLDDELHAITGKNRPGNTTLEKVTEIERIGFGGRVVTHDLLQESSTFSHAQCLAAERPTLDEKTMQKLRDDIHKNMPTGWRHKMIAWTKKHCNSFTAAAVTALLDNNRFERISKYGHFLGYNKGQHMTIADMQQYVDRLLGRSQ